MGDNTHSAIEQAKGTFRGLIARNAHQETIDLLLSLRDGNQLGLDETGWALWNLCDRHALLKRAEAQYGYQLEFWQWCGAHFPSRLHWVVSDATQANTLINGGHLAAWWEWYDLANRECPRTAENRAVRFESHRANTSAYTRFKEFEKAETAIQETRRLLEEDPTWCNRGFATACFHTLLLEHHTAKGEKDNVERAQAALESHLTEWLARVLPAGTTPGEQPILGSWAQLNQQRPPSAVFIAVNNAACSLARAGLYAPAERFFRVRLDYGMRLNAYCEAHYLLACWGNRHDREEVRALFDASAQLTAEKVARFVPELSHVLAPGETGAAQQPPERGK